jgi:predicted acetyltransferase
MPEQGPDAGKVLSLEFAALTPDAYLNLITFLGRHDIHSEVRHFAPSDDPLPLLFEDTERLEVRQGYTVMLRLVDVEAALRARPPASPEVRAEFTLEVRDRSAPWNEGTYHIAARDGAIEVERASGPAALSVDARVLAPIFNGYLTPASAAATGQLQVSDPAALPQADAFFAPTHRPHFPDRF